jgi:hypothetical protein
MPRLQFARWAGSVIEALSPSCWSHKIASPAAASSYAFQTHHKNSTAYAVQSSHKLQNAEDIWHSIVRVLNGEAEHLGPLHDPNDWPAPVLKDDLLIVNSMWTAFCYVGRTDLRTATCPPATSLQVISSAINVSPYRVTPAGGAVLLNVTDSSGGNPVTLRYSSRSDASGQGTFTTLTHGFNPDTGKLDLVPGIWDGRDRGGDSPGPPPVPPDTWHDFVAIKEPNVALMGFMATSLQQSAMLPRPITYAPEGARNGIFMPIIMRYLADRWIKKTVTTTMTKSSTKSTAAPDPGITSKPPEPIPTGPPPGGGSGFSSPIDSSPPDSTEPDQGDFGRGGPGGYLML